MQKNSAQPLPFSSMSIHLLPIEEDATLFFFHMHSHQLWRLTNLIARVLCWLKTMTNTRCNELVTEQPLLRPAQMSTNLHTLCSKSQEQSARREIDFCHSTSSTFSIENRLHFKIFVFPFPRRDIEQSMSHAHGATAEISDQLFERSKSVCSAQILTICSFNWRLTQLMSLIFSFFSSTRNLLTKNFIGDISQIELNVLPIYLKMFLILPLISFSAFAHWANFFSWCPMRLLRRCSSRPIIWLDENNKIVLFAVRERPLLPTCPLWTCHGPMHLHFSCASSLKCCVLLYGRFDVVGPLPTCDL